MWPHRRWLQAPPTAFVWQVRVFFIFFQTNQTDFIFCLVRIETNLHLNFICLQSKVTCSSGAAINMVSWSARVSSCHFLWLWIDVCCRAREWLTFTAAGRTLSQRQVSHTSNFTQTWVMLYFCWYALQYIISLQRVDGSSHGADPITDS